MTPELFQSYTSPQEDGCWYWQRSLTGKGYGKAWYEDRLLGAHVISYMLFKGHIPDGLIVRHTCHVKKCVNPDHLLIGTYSDNLQDQKLRAGRIGRFIQVPDEVVIELYKARQNNQSVASLAEKYNLRPNYINAVICGSVRKELYDKFVAESGVIPQFNVSDKYDEKDRLDMARRYWTGESPSKIAKEFGTNYKYVWKVAQSRYQQVRGDI